MTNQKLAIFAILAVIAVAVPAKALAVERYTWEDEDCTQIDPSSSLHATCVDLNYLHDLTDEHAITIQEHEDKLLDHESRIIELENPNSNSDLIGIDIGVDSVRVGDPVSFQILVPSNFDPTVDEGKIFINPPVNVGQNLFYINSVSPGLQTINLPPLTYPGNYVVTVAVNNYVAQDTILAVPLP